MYIILLAAALVTAATFGACAKFVGASKQQSIWTMLLTFCSSLSCTVLFQHQSLPPLTGYLGGYDWIMFMDCAAGLCASFFVHTIASIKEPFAKEPKGTSAKRLLAYGPIVGVNMLVFVFGLLINISDSWGKDPIAPNDFATMVADSADNQLSTHPDSFWYVKSADAFMQAKQALDQFPILSKVFFIEPDHMVPLVINHHDYYVVALEYLDSNSQTGIMGTTYAPASPGYMMVDASNLKAAAQLKIGAQYQLSYLPSAGLDKNLKRHVYDNGYSHGTLGNPTLIIDDSGHPYFTINFDKFKRMAAGEYTDKILVVDAQTGRINAYKPGAQPKWIDRVVHIQD